MENAKKILLVQLYSNGDCLYATTVAQQIKQDFPGCHLTWAISSFCKAIINNNPFVDAVMEIDSVKKNDVAAFRKFKRDILRLKKVGTFDEIFITHNMDTNQAFYDGSIRSGILRAYPHPITVPVQPLLQLYSKEIEKAKSFADTNHLKNYSTVILFEYAPLSKQSKMTKEIAISIAEKLTTDTSVAVILSSGNKVDHPNKNIIDGSTLTLRETAALTHYCTLLLGCSSGITWISTSTAAQQLPMIQILNPDTNWVNSVSRDFKMFGLDTSNIIELTHLNEIQIVNCVEDVIENFRVAKEKYNEEIPMHFKTTRSIVYNLLCYFEFKSIDRHIKVNREVYGNNFSFYKEVLLGFITAPFKLIKNIFVKKFIVHDLSGNYIRVRP